MNKTECRRLMKAKLSLMDEVELKQKSLSLSKNLVLLFSELLVIQKKMSIGAFAPLQRVQEALWYLELPSECHDLTAYPFIDSQMKVMSFKKTSLSELVEKKDFGFSILGPKEEAQQLVPEMLLIPGLAFSPKGERLGRGKGFYDKYLTHYLGIKIGVGFSLQILESLPTEEHDVKLDYIVTEEKIIKCK
ncbi:MAG: 5-formyltetrahydrofolate cyclo-ligase [Bacteriovorax sp.]|nr:5-formyltetrahydrofolate cyclo-ligase [Bacteriovorax sp.]